MSSKLPPSWQNFLNSLTLKSGEWDLLSNIDRNNELKIIKAFLNHSTLSSYLIGWMGKCLDSGRKKKSASESVAFRTKGNEEYRRHHDFSSLSLYTDCIRYAEAGSEELAIGLANRSAVFFHLKKYTECIKDAERALSLPYPKHLWLKLILRRARCYLELSDGKMCQNMVQLAEQHISQLSSTELSRFDTAIQELDTIKLEMKKTDKSETIQGLLVEDSRDDLPSLLRGINPKLPFASAALELRYSHYKGRHVIAIEDIKQGDVLFVERPYAFVILPDQFKVHCHHCSKSLAAPIACRKCVDVLFCDEACEEAAHRSYHNWECGGLALMSAVGVAHLGLRIILCSGSPAQIVERAKVASHLLQTEMGDMGYLEDSYSAVYSLLPHISDMTTDDIFQYSVTAELLTLYLIHETDYFKGLDKPVTLQSDVAAEVCALLLRHIAQLVCNAHAITKLDCVKSDCPVSMDNAMAVVPESQQRIATAIYPSASMMNHSCDPNIISCFSNECLIVKASRSIPKGEEVFNCYGPHFLRMSTAERQAVLQGQYFFTCKCRACSSHPAESVDPVQERLLALRCTSCSGPLLNEAPGREPAGSKGAKSDSSNSLLMVCNDCGLPQPISSLICEALSALSLFKKGCEKMEEGCLQDALITFNQCCEMQERALYCKNRDLAVTYDMMAKCHATLGNYDKAVMYLELMLPAVEDQFGADSIEVAHELQKLSDAMLCNLRTLETVPSMEMLENASKVVKRALSIFSLLYGPWNQGWQDLDGKLKELKLMEEMASVKELVTPKSQT